MPSEKDIAQRRRRRAWWLRVARESRGLSQSGVAEAIGLSKNSASTVGDWERQVSDPSLHQLELLAALYQTPISLFIDPPETDEERFLVLAVGAIAEERQDWESGADGAPSAAAEPDDEPRRRTT